MGTQETIIYRLVKPNLTFGPYLSFLVFEAIFGHKNGRGPTRAHMGLGAQNPTKKLTHLVDPSGPPISQNHDFEIWRPEPPLNQYKTGKTNQFLKTSTQKGKLYSFGSI